MISFLLFTMLGFSFDPVYAKCGGILFTNHRYYVGVPPMDVIDRWDLEFNYFVSPYFIVGEL